MALSRWSEACSEQGYGRKNLAAWHVLRVDGVSVAVAGASVMSVDAVILRSGGSSPAWPGVVLQS